MGTAIRDFNKKMIDYLKIFTDGIDKRKFLNVQCFQLVFLENGKKYEKKKVMPREMDAPDDFIAYYWSEFVYAENQVTYRFAMFFKDFDHNTGNIHVLPGMFQFWRKTDKNDEEGFSIDGQNSSLIQVKRRNGFERPYENHGGGRTYIEEGWKPCVLYKHGCKFYNIVLSNDCITCMVKRINMGFLEVIDNPDGFKEECKKATESKLIYNKELLDEMYGAYQGNDHGRIDSTYSMLRWVNCDEEEKPRSKKEKKEWKKMKPLFSVVHIEGLGFFNIFGQNQDLETYNLNRGKTGINTVNEYEDEGAELPNPYYWKINEKILKLKSAEEHEIIRNGVPD